MPQDVQAEALEYPSRFFNKRVWRVSGPRGDAENLRRATSLIRSANQPLLIAGGGPSPLKMRASLSYLKSVVSNPEASRQAVVKGT